MRRLMREIASGKGLNRVMPLDGSVTEGSLLNTGKPELSAGHHTPSLKRKDRHTTEVALEERKSAHTTGARAVPVQPQLWNILCNTTFAPHLRGFFIAARKVVDLAVT